MTEVVQEKINKSVFKSKTFYFGLLTAIAPLLPQVELWLEENTASVGLIWGGLAILLRMVTREKVVLID